VIAGHDRIAGEQPVVHGVRAPQLSPANPAIRGESPDILSSPKGKEPGHDAQLDTPEQSEKKTSATAMAEGRPPQRPGAPLLVSRSGGHGLKEYVLQRIPNHLLSVTARVDHQGVAIAVLRIRGKGQLLDPLLLEPLPEKS